MGLYVLQEEERNRQRIAERDAESHKPQNRMARFLERMSRMETRNASVTSQKQSSPSSADSPQPSRKALPLLTPLGGLAAAFARIGKSREGHQRRSDRESPIGSGDKDRENDKDKDKDKDNDKDRHKEKDKECSSDAADSNFNSHLHKNRFEPLGGLIKRIGTFGAFAVSK